MAHAMQRRLGHEVLDTVRGQNFFKRVGQREGETDDEFDARMRAYAETTKKRAEKAAEKGQTTAESGVTQWLRSRNEKAKRASQAVAAAPKYVERSAEELGATGRGVDVDGDGTIDKTEWDFGTGPTPTLEYRPQAYSWQLMVPHTRSTPEYEALLRYWREQQSSQASRNAARGGALSVAKQNRRAYGASGPTKPFGSWESEEAALATVTVSEMLLVPGAGGGGERERRAPPRRA